MSKITNRDTAAAPALRATARQAPTDEDSLEHRLARLPDTSLLARVVPHLPPETLHHLIRVRGLDACGELATSATPAQLTAVLDLDLWRPARPGGEPLFDIDRFGEWLEVLVDAGHSVAARTIAALDEHLVVAGLSRCVRVCDPGIFEPTAQSDDEPTDRHEAMREGDSIHADETRVHGSSAGSLECEVGGYIVRARRTDAWDAIVTLLVALDAEHGSYFHAVMQGCRRFSNSRPEIDGLDDLLLAPEQHLLDVTIEWDRRRSRQGYATPADARAFLEMARQATRTQSSASTAATTAINPIVAAYFRAADEARESPDEAAKAPALHAPATDGPESIDAVLELLIETSHVRPGYGSQGAGPERPLALLEAGGADRLTRVRRLMAFVRDTDEPAYFARSRELAFLANTLLAGCSVQSRPFTPQEASDAAAGICNLGLEHWPQDFRWRRSRQGSGGRASEPPDSSPPDSWLVDHDLVSAFEVGWSVLHQDVSLFAADELVSTLTAIDCVDRDIRRGLDALRRTLVKERKAGTPWRARDAAEVLAMLDMTAWIGVLGLLDECPVLAAALTAIIDGRTTSVSPTEFEFISTTAQIGDVHAFMRKLPGVLSC
jgi:hypothetical protein